MAAHAPYIMPDGRSLTHYLAQEREREQLRRRKAELRGKDLQFAQLVRQRGAAMSDLELAELKAMEQAGVRRRRRWLNDKTLRDLAGPLSAADMEAQFKPAPFGLAVPSALAQATAPANAALWDNFRNIDPEKEARVLQKWAAHQRESAPVRRRPLTQAALALQRWAAVGKKARAALKRANPSSVMQLELQILDFFEKAAPGAQLLLPLEDGFARLLVHGLAEFYGLLSTSRVGDNGTTQVAVYRRTKPLAASGAPVQVDISLGLGVGVPQLQLKRSASTGRAGSTGASPNPSPSPRAGGGGLSRRSGGIGASSTGPSPARAPPAAGSVSSTVSSQQPGSAAPVASAPAGASPSPTPSPGRRAGACGGRVGGASPQQSRGAGAGGDAPVGGGGASAPRMGSLGRGGGTEAGGGGGSGAGRDQGAEPADPDITCTDVLLALAEVGQMGLNEEALRRYVHVHIHGTMTADGQYGHSRYSYHHSSYSHPSQQ